MLNMLKGWMDHLNGLFHLKSTPPLWKKDNGIPIPAGLDVKSSRKIFVSLMQVPAEHCGRFWYQVWFQLDPVTFERKIPADDFGRLYRIINFQLEFLFEISIPEDSLWKILKNVAFPVGFLKFKFLHCVIMIEILVEWQRKGVCVCGGGRVQVCVMYLNLIILNKQPEICLGLLHKSAAQV